MGTYIDRKKLRLALVVLWFGIAIPLSEPIYDEVFSHDLLNRIFVWALVGAPAWLPVVWKWITNDKVFSRSFLLSVLAVHIILFLLFLDDRYLDDYAFVPIFCILGFIGIVVAYDGKQLIKRSSPGVVISDETREDVRKRLQNTIEANAHIAKALADDLMHETSIFVTSLNPDTLSHKQLSALESAGLRSEVTEFQRDKVAAEYSLVCAISIYGKPFEDFSKTATYEDTCSHFLSKKGATGADPEQMGYIVRNDLPRLLKLAKDLDDAKYPNVQAAVVFSVLMKLNGFPNPLDNEEHKIKVGRFGVRSLNGLRDAFKTSDSHQTHRLE